MESYKGQSRNIFRLEGRCHNMSFFDENLYFYFISLKTDFINFDEYNEWLNEQFLADDSREILLDLQFCTENVKKTIETMNYYLFNKVAKLDYQVIGKAISRTLRLRNIDDMETLREISEKLYQMWCLLPRETSEEKPFIFMNSIDDPWSWDDSNRVVDGIKWLSHYYDNL